MEKLMMLVGVLLDLVETEDTRETLQGEELNAVRVLLKKTKYQVIKLDTEWREAHKEVVELYEKVDGKSRLISELQQLLARNQEKHGQELKNVHVDMAKLEEKLQYAKAEVEGRDRQVQDLHQRQRFMMDMIEDMTPDGKGRTFMVEAAVFKALRAGKSKTDCIKHVRFVTNCGLKEAKELVDRMLASVNACDF